MEGSAPVMSQGAHAVHCSNTIASRRGNAQVWLMPLGFDNAKMLCHCSAKAQLDGSWPPSVSWHQSRNALQVTAWVHSGCKLAPSVPCSLAT